MVKCMTSDNDNSTRRAVDHLEGLGLSAYAARTFAGLIALESPSAKEVSEVVDVPRTRVYDAAEELAGHGLVTVESSTPRRFHAVSIDEAVSVLSSEHTKRVDEAVTDLAALAGTDNALSRDDLWLLTDDAAIADRIEQFLASAAETVFFATAREPVREATADALVEAAQRGLSVSVARVDQSVHDRLDSLGLTVDRRERPWDSDTLPISTVLIVDDERALVTFETDETLAFWSVGEPNNLLVLLSALLGIQE